MCPITSVSQLDQSFRVGRTISIWLTPNRQSADLKTINGALDHMDLQSSVRYQDADVEIVRERGIIESSSGSLS